MPVLGSIPNPKSKSKTDSKPKTGSEAGISTPTEDTAGNPPTNTAGVSGPKSLSGIPLGTDIRTSQTRPEYQGSTFIPFSPTFNAVQYTTESPYQIPATMSNQEKANLLLRLSLIPNIYAAGQAPTEAFIRSQGDAISFRPADYAALTKIMIHADTVGKSYDQSIQTFLASPSLADQYFGKVSEVPKKIATTPADALYSEMTSRFQDMFDAKPEKKDMQEYAKEVNKAELAAKGAGLTQTQREDIFLKYVQKTAMGRFKTVTATEDTVDDALLEKGALGAVVMKIRGAYADNGIPANDRQIYKDAIAGVRSQQALSNTLKNVSDMASVQFPAIKDWLSKGNTAKSFFTPYISSYSKIYGVPEDQVDISKFYNVASGTVPVPVSQWEKDQWKNPEIKNTDFYHQVRKNDLRAVTEAFGIGV